MERSAPQPSDVDVPGPAGEHRVRFATRTTSVQLAAESAICFAIGAHAHLVSVRRIVTTSKGLLIAMDLVEGTDLRAHAGKTYNGPLYQGGREAVNARVNSIVAQLYEGLGHLHE